MPAAFCLVILHMSIQSGPAEGLLNFRCIQIVEDDSRNDYSDDFMSGASPAQKAEQPEHQRNTPGERTKR